MEESALIRREERAMRFSLYWFAAKSLKWLLALGGGILALLFWGCGAKTVTVTEYKTVEVPIKCRIEAPTKPLPEGDAIELNFRILEYTKKLEAALKACE